MWRSFVPVKQWFAALQTDRIAAPLRSSVRWRTQNVCVIIWSVIIFRDLFHRHADWHRAKAQTAFFERLLAGDVGRDAGCDRCRNRCGLEPVTWCDLFSVGRREMANPSDSPQATTDPNATPAVSSPAAPITRTAAGSADADTETGAGAGSGSTATEGESKSAPAATAAAAGGDSQPTSPPPTTAELPNAAVKPTDFVTTEVVAAPASTHSVAAAPLSPPAADSQLTPNTTVTGADGSSGGESDVAGSGGTNDSKSIDSAFNKTGGAAASDSSAGSLQPVVMERSWTAPDSVASPQSAPLTTAAAAVAQSDVAVSVPPPSAPAAASAVLTPTATTAPAPTVRSAPLGGGGGSGSGGSGSSDERSYRAQLRSKDEYILSLHDAAVRRNETISKQQIQIGALVRVRP